MNVLITGGTSGIGFSLALKLIKNGHFVYLCVHNKKEIKTTLEKIKNIDYQDRVSVMKLDITKKDDRQLVSKLDIDCLVNQAGIGIGGSLINMEISDIRKNFDINFFGTLALTQEYIKSRGNKKGKVLITSSLAGIMPIPYLGSYSATKAALSIFTRALRLELKKTNKNIKIRLIEPGAYKTGFNQYMIESKERLDFDEFIESKESIIENQRKLFAIFEKENLSSIVNKMYRAIVSNNSKLVYRSPLLHVIGAKLYMIFFE